jgi:opacity protein-like surface antigen
MIFLAIIAGKTYSINVDWDGWSTAAYAGISSPLDSVGINAGIEEFLGYEPLSLNLDFNYYTRFNSWYRVDILGNFRWYPVLLSDGVSDYNNGGLGLSLLKEKNGFCLSLKGGARICLNESYGVYLDIWAGYSHPFVAGIENRWNVGIDIVGWFVLAAMSGCYY